MSKKEIAVVLTDVHISESTIGTCKGIFNQVVDHCNKKKIYKVICSGDMFTYRKGLSQEVGLAFLEILDLLGRNNIELLTVVGNHDKTDLESEKSYLDFFKTCPSLNLVREYATFELNGLKVGFLSYFKEGSEILKQHLSSVLRSKPDVLFTHLAINGVRNNDGTIVNNDLEGSLFEGVRYVYVGHYHNASKIGRNIHYIGSAYQGNYGENEDKGLFFLMEDGSLERIETAFPRYTQVKTSFSNLERSIDTLVRSGSEHSRLVIEDLQENLRLVDKGGLEAKYSIEVVLVELVEERVDEESTQFKSFTPQLLIDSFDSFALSKQIEQGEVDECKKIMLETIKED